MKKNALRVLLVLAFVVVLVTVCTASDSGIYHLQSDASTISLFVEGGTPETFTVSGQTYEGVYSGAEKVEVACTNLTSGDEYVLLVLEGSTTPNDENIVYIDQQTAVDGNANFTVYPMRLEGGTKYYIMLSGTHSALTQIGSFDYLSLASINILTQPAPFSGKPSDTAVFSVEAEGEGLSYQWQYLPAGASDWVDCDEPSSNTSALQVTATEARNGQSFRCVITDASGDSVVSDSAALTVSGEQPNPFKDVAKGKFYYDPVLWAISQDPQITTGVTSTTFEPDRTCTRGHVVTFLWRANGCPEPASMTNSFKDVPNGKYYTKAVLWAAEQGITTGYKDGTFRPDDSCTRGQVVTFLWRAKGQPAPTSTTNPFSDVPSGQYYTTAVLWALQNNITKGRTATTFGPDDDCTRGHVVTFLYRAYA